MAEQYGEEWISEALDERTTAIPNLSDLLGLWRETPPDELDADHPGCLLRESYVHACTVLADTKPWAWEGLERLLNYLLENGEPVPRRLYLWGLHQYMTGRPARRPGRPEKSERDLRVAVVFTMLRRDGYTREKAIGAIADQMECFDHTIGSIIYKHRDALPRRP